MAVTEQKKAIVAQMKETLSDYLEAQVLWQQAYQTKVDTHFQLYVNYVAYLKAAGQL